MQVLIGIIIGAVGFYIVARYLGARWTARTVELLQEELRNPEPWTDPLITIRNEDGAVIMEMTLWEWIGRAIVNHALPPAELDTMKVYLDGIPVNR